MPRSASSLETFADSEKARSVKTRNSAEFSSKPFPLNSLEADLKFYFNFTPQSSLRLGPFVPIGSSGMVASRGLDTCQHFLDFGVVKISSIHKNACNFLRVGNVFQRIGSEQH